MRKEYRETEQDVSPRQHAVYSVHPEALCWFSAVWEVVRSKFFRKCTQLGYITNVAAGCGLIRCAGNIVPFENNFPRNTQLYKLMTTKPDEAIREM